MNITEQLTKTSTLYKKNKNSDSLRRSTLKKETDVYQDQKKIDECLFASNTEGLKLIYPKLNLRNTGCAALDMAYVASGRYDGYWRREINYWDIAAGIILIKESGGFINTIKGDSFDGEKIDIIASNSKIHEELKKLL